MSFLFPPEVGRNLSPLLSIPFNYRYARRVCTQPLLRPPDNVEERCRLRCQRQLGLTLFFVDPQNGVVRIGIDNLVCDAQLLHQCQRMNDGKELTDVVRTMHRSEMEHLRTRRQVYAPILHRSGITRTGSIDGPCSRKTGASPYPLRREGKLPIVICFF